MNLALPSEVQKGMHEEGNHHLSLLKTHFMRYVTIRRLKHDLIRTHTCPVLTCLICIPFSKTEREKEVQKSRIGEEIGLQGMSERIPARYKCKTSIILHKYPNPFALISSFLFFKCFRSVRRMLRRTRWVKDGITLQAHCMTHFNAFGRAGQSYW